MSHRPLCRACTYDLTAATSNTCPECGTRFEVRVYSDFAPRSYIATRTLAAALALTALIFCLAQISHGYLQFWVSPQSAAIVFLCTPLLLFVALGPQIIASAFHTLARRTADPTTNSKAAATFRLTAAIALAMGTLGSILGLAQDFAFFGNADLGTLGHAVATALCSQLYAFFIAIPAFLASATISRRIDDTHISHFAHTTRTSLKIAAGASIAATLIAAASLGIVLWSAQR